MSSMAESWYVYVLVSTVTKRTYVGIALDPEKRLEEHNGDLPGGAKATRPWRPWKIARIYGPVASRSEATKLERQIKQEPGQDRLTVDWSSPTQDRSS